MLNSLRSDDSANTAGAEVIDIASRRRLFISEIKKFADSKRDRADALTRQDFGQLESLSRLVAQRQALLDGVAVHYAANPKAEVEMGVYVVVTTLSDNSEGCCRLSMSWLSAFLSRDPRTVAGAIDRLVADNLIFVEPVAGRPNNIWPYVHKEFGQSRDSLAWIVDVHSPAEGPRRPVGRPRKHPIERQPEIPPSPCMPPLFFEQDENTPLKHDAPPISNNEKYPPHSNEIPPSHCMPPDTINTRGKKMIVGERAGLHVDEESLDIFNDVYNSWGMRGETPPAPANRSATDFILDAELGIHARTNVSQLGAALVAALNTTLSMSLQGPDRAGGTSMVRYFHKALRSSVDEQKLREANTAAQARADQEITSVVSASASPAWNDQRSQTVATGGARLLSAHSGLETRNDPERTSPRHNTCGDRFSHRTHTSSRRQPSIASGPSAEWHLRSAYRIPCRFAAAWERPKPSATAIRRGNGRV